jgi:hypothetical protein
MELELDVSVFERWSRDPEFDRLVSESKDPATFDHNVLLLTLASIFEDSGLGPEVVPPGRGVRQISVCASPQGGQLKGTSRVWMRASG